MAAPLDGGALRAQARDGLEPRPPPIASRGRGGGGGRHRDRRRRRPGGVPDLRLVALHDAAQRLGGVDQEVPTVGDLDRARRAGAGRLGAGAGPVAADHGDARVGGEPVPHRRGRPARQEVDGAAPLEVADDTVSPLTGMASRRDRRAPASPPSAMPMSVCASANRPVRRALAPPRPGTRSAKVRPEQWPQRKRRAWTRHVTARSRQGRSWNVRRWRPCTRAEAWPHTGQDASAAAVLAVTTRPAASSVRPSTCRPAGTVGREGFEIGIARALGRHPAINAPIAARSPHHRL